MVDASPYQIWSTWGAGQRDLFFLDAAGNYHTDFNITNWDYDLIYNTIINIISDCTNPAACNYDETATLDDGSCEFYDGCGECGGNGINSNSYGDCECEIDGDFYADCLGICGGNAVEDTCGTCDSDSDNDCIQDCAGNWGGVAETDYCGNCQTPTGTENDDNLECNTSDGCEKDCSGICGGSAEEDECGVCEGDNSTCKGCMDDTACNYNDCNGYETFDDLCIIKDNQLCIYPDEVYMNCDGSCINDSNGDGVCDELSLYNGLIPEDFNIHNIYPNPFNPITNIIYGIPEYTNVQIIVYDLSGKQIETLVNQFQTPGYHSVDWNADNHPSGVYFVKMVADDYVNTQKLMLIK